MGKRGFNAHQVPCRKYTLQISHAGLIAKDGSVGSPVLQGLPEFSWPWLKLMGSA